MGLAIIDILIVQFFTDIGSLSLILAGSSTDSGDLLDITDICILARNFDPVFLLLLIQEINMVILCRLVLFCKVNRTIDTPMVAAKIQNQVIFRLTVQEHPDVIIAGELEYLRYFFSINRNRSVFVQGKRNDDSCSESVIVVDTGAELPICPGRIIKREETICI